MKKYLLLIVTLWVSFFAAAQFNVSNPSGYVLLNNNATYGVDALVLFNGISSMSEIMYTGTEDVEWKLYDGSFYSNQKSISPDNATGYVLWINGTAKYFVWAIDYTQYLAQLQSIAVEPSDYDCERLSLQITANVPNIVYVDRNNNNRTLERDFNVDYISSEFVGDAWSEKPETSTFRAPLSTVIVTAPLKSTMFYLSGDQWAVQLGLPLDSIVSDVYDAVAVECHPLGSIVEREALNEKDRSSTTINGSGPLVVDFTSNCNPVPSIFYEWTLWNVNTPNNYIRYADPNFRYTFNETGEYYVKLKANTESCECVDSILVTVRESFLEVPNVFTPNGDGINDEFRVAYRSLATFQMTVFNRWGRVVYESTNPGKGWNGKINGREAAEGTYYYVIQAKGTDKNSHGKTIHYKLSGAVSLLR